MTLERAQQICADNACTIEKTTPQWYTIYRTPDNYGHISETDLASVSESKFIAFFLPDARD